MADPHPLVCRFGAFGDMVLLTPLLRQLYERSGLPCDVLAQGGWNRMLFQQMPYVRNVITVDSRSGPYWLNRSMKDLVKTLTEHQHQFVWVCETSSKSYRLLGRAGITHDNSANEPKLVRVAGEHYCDKWLRLGNESPPGFDFPPCAQASPDPVLFVSDDELAECRKWLSDRNLDPQKPLICVQAGNKRTMRPGKANRASNTKYWPEHNWAQVVDGVIEQLPQAQVLLCGVPREAPMCDSILELCRRPEQVVMVADDLPMRRLLALLSIAHSCISVDTGPAHAAAALDCPLVVLFGQADPARFRPVSSSSPVEILLGHESGKDQSRADIKFISPQQVLQAWSTMAG